MTALRLRHRNGRWYVHDPDAAPYATHRDRPWRRIWPRPDAGVDTAGPQWLAEVDVHGEGWAEAVPVEAPEPVGDTTRPLYPYDAPADCHWVASPASLEWRLKAGKRCRWMEHRRRCDNPSVAELNRSTSSRPLWWAYCADHLYGRWIEDGQVMQWVLRPVEDAETGDPR